MKSENILIICNDREKQEKYKKYIGDFFERDIKEEQ